MMAGNSEYKTNYDDSRFEKDAVSTPRENSSDTRAKIILTGGQHDHWGGMPVYSAEVEAFDWSTQTWKQLNPMFMGRSSACSFVYEGQVMVCGGCIDNGTSTDTMESLNVEDAVSSWQESVVKLPFKCYNHVVVNHRDNLILSGASIQGADGSHKCSDAVYELQLVSPCCNKVLTRLPRLRYCHGMELFDEKLFIFGGTVNFKAVNSVVEYNLETKEYKEMPSLPYAVRRMATVLWQDSVILLAGVDENRSLNKVVMYNVITGESKMLPCMKRKRCDCTAVLVGNRVVVMGGWDGREFLKSVECFDLDRQVWQDLPDMLLARAAASAVVVEVT